MQHMTSRAKRAQNSGNLKVLYLFFLFSVTMCAYYGLGPSHFPDYQNYVLISQGKHFNQYFFEVVSQYILTHDIFPFRFMNRVDALALIAQILFLLFLFFIVLKEKRIVSSTVIFASIFFPFLLTTALRAAPVYLAFFFWAHIWSENRVGLLKFSLMILLSGILFHDSGIVLAINLLATYPLLRFSIGERWIVRICILISLIIVNFGASGILSILSTETFELAGARSVYFLVENQSTFAKTAFMNLLVLVTYLYYRDPEVRAREKKVACVLLLVTSFLFAVAPVAAVRYAFFLFIFMFSTRHVAFIGLEKSSRNWIVLLPFYFSVFLIQLWALI